MNQNSNAIITLCSHLCVGENAVPLEPAEWNALAKRLVEESLQPSDLFGLSSDGLVHTLRLTTAMAERILRLLDRSAALSSELSSYENRGIVVVTRADSTYPQTLRKTLGNYCPPLFYCAGDFTLLQKRCIGYVGSRVATQEDIAFTQATVRKTALHGFGVVSGGAKGIDRAAQEAAIQLACGAVEYLADSLQKKLRFSATAKAVQNGQLFLLTAANPDAGFRVSYTMVRNRYIYAHSCGTVVIRSDYNKGGTWAGATDNLRHQWCKQFCRRYDCRGNNELIAMGAIPIDEHWDGDADAANMSHNSISRQLRFVEI